MVNEIIVFKLTWHVCATLSLMIKETRKSIQFKAANDQFIENFKAQCLT